MEEMKELRYSIMELVFGLNNVDTLSAVKEQLQSSPKKSLPIWDAAKPTRKNVSLATMAEEQNYQRVSYQKFRTDADAIEFDESLDDLLGALTK